MLYKIFSHPKRLFCCLFIVTIFGLYSGFNLPISMYPASSKPVVNMWIPYGTYSASDFREKIGNTVESRIKAISNSELTVDNVEASYQDDNAMFKIEFAWNTKFDKAKQEVESIASGISSLVPKEISDRIGVWQRNRNSGFFAASLYSDDHNLRDLYNLIEPILKPELDAIQDAENPVIWNPESYIISVRLIPEKMALYGIYPQEIKTAIKNALSSFSGSSVKFGQNTQKFEIEASVQTADQLAQISLNHQGRSIYLKDIAEVDFGRDLHRERNFKTNGINSLILFAKPKSGANVKQMSEDIMSVLHKNKPILPKSMKIKLIVDPAESIKKSVNNLIKDVIVAACMAVLVLFLFIGGLKNIGTAAIEIPLSMILSFILMKYAGMNLNLISLGGLALAAGMNVDASIVIMENIFKHRAIWAKQNRSCQTFSERLELVHTAVSEVAAPVFLSILTTLIVFIPMAFTSDLTNAILGDLARAVIFSHAISGFVAIIVVPSVRVLVLKNYKDETKAPLEGALNKFQSFYEKSLDKLLLIRKIKYYVVILPLITLSLLIYFVFPNLPKEVIGKPGSDWIYMYINSYGTHSGRHMENIMQEVEEKALRELEGRVDYTWFEKHNQNGGQIMFKLFDRADMEGAEKKLKEIFINTSDTHYYISNWNPAELPLPRERHFMAVVKGQAGDIQVAASRVQAFLKEEDSFERVRSEPSVVKNSNFVFKPNIEQIQAMNNNNFKFSPLYVADISQLTKQPESLGELSYQKRSTEIKLSMIDDRFTDPEQLEAFPIRAGDKIIPLNALGSFQSVKKVGTLIVKNGKPQITISANVGEDDSKNWEQRYLTTKEALSKKLETFTKGTTASIELLYPQQELKDALNQLLSSLFFSLCLIFFVLWMQFQSVKQVAVIMMTIPLGIIGVISALFIFDSYLSLNSALGIILLNGITVNNSILLTDVRNTLYSKGLRGRDLVISAAKKRLRPILITSLTTILGMLPVAFGFGDGGKILQPLGIAVTCGLFIASSITLFIVPILLYKDEEKLVISPENKPETPIKFHSEEQPII